MELLAEAAKAPGRSVRVHLVELMGEVRIDCREYDAWAPAVVSQSHPKAQYFR